MNECNTQSNLSLKEPDKNFLTITNNSTDSTQSSDMTIDARLLNENADYTKAVSNIKAQLVNIQTVNLINGIKISGELGPGMGQGQKTQTGVLKYKQGAILVETTNFNENVFDQILQTFKFTQ